MCYGTSRLLRLEDSSSSEMDNSRMAVKEAATMGAKAPGLGDLGHRSVPERVIPKHTPAGEAWQ